MKTKQHIPTFTEVFGASPSPDDNFSNDTLQRARDAIDGWSNLSIQTYEAARAAGRDLLADEQKRVNRAQDELDEFRSFVTAYDASHTITEAPGLSSVTPWARQNIREGVGDVLAPEHRMVDWVRARGIVPDDQRELSFGKWLRGIATGDWRDAEAERRALSEGTLAGGGYAVPVILSAELIDRARALAAVLRAGARTVPMDSQTVNIARVAGDPTASWKAENAVITDSDMTFEQVQLKAHTLVALTRASRELIEDSVNAEDALRDAFAAQLALTLDMAALFGSGTDPEPRGLKNQTGVTKLSAGANGAAISYDLLVDLITTTWTSNEATATAVIHAPRTERQVLKLKDSQGNPLTLPRVVADVPRYVTNQVGIAETQGTATNASSAFAGDWEQLLIGVRHGLSIEVLKERYADAYQLGFLAHMRADVAPARPAAFAVLEGLIP